MPGQNDKMSMEQQKQRVNEILHSETTRVATDVSWKENGYDKAYNNLQDTKEEVKFIDQILNLPATSRMQFEDKDLFLLQAIQGRDLSHLLLNEHKFGGDSEEMENVKLHVRELERLIATANWDSNDLEPAYERAIAACQV